MNPTGLIIRPLPCTFQFLHGPVWNEIKNQEILKFVLDGKICFKKITLIETCLKYQYQNREKEDNRGEEETQSFPLPSCFELGPKVQGEKGITEWLLNSVSEVSSYGSNCKNEAWQS